MRSILIVKMLGAFEIIRDGRQVRVERTKHKALIAYLSTSRGKWCPRSLLADLLWEDSSEEKSRHSLNQALYSLRRLLPEFLIVQKESVQCNADSVITDLDQVSKLIKSGDVRGALSTMRGGFLEDVDIRNAPEFERWKSDFNRSFYQANQRVLLPMIGGLSLTEQYQLDRESCCFNFLPEIHELLTSPVDVRRDSIDPMPTAPSPPIRHSFTLPFTGRDRDLSILHAMLSSCGTGKAAFVVLTGQPGIGKTRLAEEFLTTATGVRSIRLKCYEAEQRVGFGPIVDLLTYGFSPGDLAGLQPIWKTVLGELAPERFATKVAPPRLSGLSGQSRLFQAVLQALKEVAKEDPLLLFVDDVQWMDRSTRALFSFLTHRLDNERVMVVAALRRKSTTSAIPSPWSGWTRIDITELAHDQASQIVEQTVAQLISPDPQFRNILKLTGGHPYLLSEVLGRVAMGDTADLRILEREIPPRVEEFVGSLFHSIPRQSQQLLAVLALLGRPAPANILRRISRIKNLSVPLDTLVEREIAAVNKQGIGLRHDLIREAAYRRIPLFTRTALHRRAAKVLANTDDNTGEAAEHFYKGGLRTQAFEHALKAAKIADDRHAFAESVSYLRLAAKARPSRTKIVSPALADRLYRLHRLREARTALQRRLKNDDQPPKDLQIFDLELAYALGEITGMELRSATSRLKHAAVIEPELMFRLLRLEVRSAHHDGDPRNGLAAVNELRRLGLEVGGYEGLEAIAHAGRAHSLLVSSVEGERWVLDAVAKVNGIPENEAGIRTMGLLATILYEVGKLEAAERMLRQAMRSAEAIGAISEWPLSGVHAHMLMVEQGKFDLACELAREVRRRVLPEEAARALAALAANEAAMNFELQNYELAEQLISEVLQYTSGTSAIWVELEITGLRGLIFLAQGRVAEAQKCNVAAKGRAASLGYRSGDVSSMEILNSRLHHRRGDTDLAVEQLTGAIADYRERDVVCRLRMEFELARLLKSIDRTKARAQANSVFLEASRIGARPLAEQADALLLRL